MIFGKFDEFNQAPVLKVIGVGGGGGNAVDRMIENEVRGVEFIAVNTDVQDLQRSQADIRVQIGKQLTKGQGAGAKPEVGRNAALESEDDLREVIAGADLVFITCGMGGGTGTGAAPIIARIARELGCLTIGIVTKPFQLEGPERMSKAAQGLAALKENVDTLIVIPNQKLFSIIDEGTSILDAFREADIVLRQGVQGISEIINFPGTINIDFADVKTVIKDKGAALLGIGVATGKNRGIEAARRAINSPLLEVSIDGATDAIVNIASSQELSLVEFQSISDELKNQCGQNINLIIGIAINNMLKDEVVVTVVATGYELKAKENGIDILTENIFNNTKDKVDFKELLKTTSDDPVDEEKDITKIFDKPKKPFLFGKNKNKEKESKVAELENKTNSTSTQAEQKLPDWLKK
ncbi:MAG: cell division protein FtsZ [Anaeroplasmataceae bacterium]